MFPPIDLVVVTDGRTAYLKRSLESWGDLSVFSKVIVVNDAESPLHAKYVEQAFAGAEIVHHPEKSGMAQSVRSGWAHAEADYVLHFEEDFVAIRPLPDLGEVCAVLDEHAHLANMGFKRKPWWGREVELGDQLAAMCEQSARVQEHECWTEHDAIYSLNPHLVPRRVFERGWPDGNEAGQTALCRERGETFGMWGHVGDDYVFAHIGVQRSAGWKL